MAQRWSGPPPLLLSDPWVLLLMTQAAATTTRSRPSCRTREKTSSTGLVGGVGGTGWICLVVENHDGLHWRGGDDAGRVYQDPITVKAHVPLEDAAVVGHESKSWNVVAVLISESRFHGHPRKQFESVYFHQSEVLSQAWHEVEPLVH